MTDAGKLPTSGYAFERTYATHQSLLVLESQENLPADAGLIFGWDWQLIGDRRFDVTLQFGIDASAQRPEEIRVTLTGRFRVMADQPEVDLPSFVRYHAPAILMPYVREIVTGLTSRGFFGPIVLPPINVQVLMESQDPGATTGAQQIGTGSADVLLNAGVVSSGN